MADRTDRVLLQYTVDEAALERAQQDTAALESSVAEFGASTEKTFAAVAENANSSLNDLRAELNSLKEDLPDEGGGGGISLGGLGGGALRESARGVADLATQAGIANPAIGQLTRVIGSMNPVAIGLGLVMVPLVAVFQDMEKQAKATQAAVDAAVAADAKAHQERLTLEQRTNEALAGDSGARTQIFKDFAGAISDSNNAAKQQIYLIAQRSTAQAEADKERAIAEAHYSEGGFDAIGKAAQDAFTKANDAVSSYDKQIADNTKTMTDAGGSVANYKDAVAKLTPTQQELTDVMLAVNQGAEGASKSLDKLNTSNKNAFDNLLKTFDGLSAGVQTVAKVIGEDLAKALAEQVKQQADIAASVKKYNADVAGINDSFHASEAALEKKAADDQIRIIRQASDAANQALQQLEDTQAKDRLNEQRAETDATTKLDQKEADDQLRARRQEAADLANHLKTLQDIRQRSQDQEFEQGLDRDFAGLARTRRQTSQQVRDENQNFVLQQQQRTQQLQQSLQDDQTSFERERAQRLVNLGRQLSDADAAYKVQLAQMNQQRITALARAKAADDTELRALQDKTSKALQIRRDGEIAELKLLSQSAQERLKIEQQTQTALLQQAAALLSAIGGGGGGSASRLTTRAGGGNLDIGDMALVNDAFRGQRESFNGQAFPPGLGLFIPAQSGNVSPGKGANVTINMPISSNSASPEAVGAVVERKLDNVLGRIFK